MSFAVMSNNRFFSSRDEAILIGLYLSKFDNLALKEFGFDGFMQAYNTLGYSIGVKPYSIKNYRDEFDPYFPNQRQGWRNRKLREYCKKFLDEFSSHDFALFTDLIKSFIIQNYDVEKIIKNVEKKDMSESIAKRLITGKAAEEYFKTNYPHIEPFIGFKLKDTTNLACGFDFKLSCNADFYCVEVKGLNLNTGNIIMTEKEYAVAHDLQDKYCLFLVKNFIEKPVHQYVFNPLNSGLNFKKVDRMVVQTSYLTSF
jgi:hypothetical protein